MDYEFETRAVRGDPSRDTHATSIHLNGDEMQAFDNKSKRMLEDRIASLEHAKYCLCFSSGLAAVSSISMLLQKGDHVVIFDSVYHGTRTYLSIREALGHVDVTFTDLRDPDHLQLHLRKNTKMVWIETPCNPTMKVVDIAAIAAIVRQHAKAVLVVDNTFMSAYFQNPLLLGADVVMHSLTKYMNGHSDVLMGTAATNSEEIFEKLRAASKTIGSLPSSLECYLTLRGLRTLPLRMERHAENATRIAHFLEGHPKVERVFYPGLKSHPQHSLALKQCRGFSGMVSFCVRGGSREVKLFSERIKIFTLAVSLGTVESLIDIPSLMTASALSADKRAELEISDNLIRMSVGLEDARDLISDIDQALSGI